IPFCARICPYCAFYKERADPAQATRFCEAILTELRAVNASVAGASLCQARGKGLRPGGRSGGAVSPGFQRKASTAMLLPETIFFGGGTPTALTTAQLDFLLSGFHAQ